MITFFVPALNEQENVEGVVQTLTSACSDADVRGYEIFFVNDGSSDKTGEIADEIAERTDELKVLHNEQNIGIGASFKKVLELSTKPLFIIVSGDNDIPKKMLVDMLIASKSSELVLGYRINRELRGLGRNIFSTTFNAIYMVAFSIYVQYLNGPMIFQTQRVKNMKLRATRFSICAEINIRLLKQGVSFCEIQGVIASKPEKTSAFKIMNFIEVFTTFVGLLIDIYVLRKAEYNGVATRHLQARW